MVGVTVAFGEVMGYTLVLVTSETGVWRESSFLRGRRCLAGY